MTRHRSRALPPRRLPDLSFPAYRHRPGITPHPRRDPAGHSHGRPEPSSPPLGEIWREHRAWLAGIDLFHHGYWWEAHEWWEAAWRATQEPSRRHLLQGLIQVAAALLKWDTGNPQGRDKLWRRAREHLTTLGDTSVAGMDAAGLVHRLDDLFRREAVPPAPAVVLPLLSPA